MFVAQKTRFGQTIYAIGDNERTERLHRLRNTWGVELIGECAFGSSRFLDLVREQEYDVLCLHHAEVGDYRNPDFDIAQALERNTFNLREVLKHMRARAEAGRSNREFLRTGRGGGQPAARSFFSLRSVERSHRADRALPMP